MDPRTGRPSVRRTTSTTSSTYRSASPRSAAVRTQPWTWSSRTRIETASTRRGARRSAGGCRRSTPRARSSARSPGPGPRSGSGAAPAAPCPCCSCGGTTNGRRAPTAGWSRPCRDYTPWEYPNRCRPSAPGFARLMLDGRPRTARDTRARVVPSRVRPRERGGARPDPRLLRGPLGVRAATPSRSAGRSTGDVVESFSPDFYLPDLDLYVELTTLKQKLVRKKNRKLRRLRELYPGIRIKLFYARDFRQLLLKFGRLALLDDLSGTTGQATPPRSADRISSRPARACSAWPSCAAADAGLSRSRRRRRPRRRWAGATRRTGAHSARPSPRPSTAPRHHRVARAAWCRTGDDRR